MIYHVIPYYSDKEPALMLRYFGSGDGPKYCGERKLDDEFKAMLKIADGRLCDFTHIKPGVMACNRKVKDAIGLQLQSNVQFLPISVNGMELYVINITSVVDVLNHEMSSVKRLPDGRIMKISPCVIDEGELSNFLLFKIPENSCKAMFATDKFKVLIEKNGFNGLRFIPLPATI